jgi:hypothetical protein
VECAKKIEGLEVQVIGDRVVVYEMLGRRLHYLNPTAALLLELCDGNRSTEEIARLVQEAYGLEEAPVDDVVKGLAALRKSAIVV